VAKYLYSDLKIDEYKALHHTKKLSILREIIIDRLSFKNEYLSVCSRFLYYALELEPISILTIQKKRYLENDYFFDKSASLRDFRSRLGRLKKEHLRLSKALQNKKHVNEGKKGVYVLLDSDYQKKLEIALKGNKTTLTALFNNFIDSLQPTTKA
jgi:hypothetical protein